ncbi:MAG: hypothetical protein PVI38_07340 [Desulfobacterales bacterium]|jgi:hypothetical protein
MADDLEQLKLLSIFHYIVGGIMLFFSLFPLIHVGFGLFMILSPESFFDNAGEQPPEFIGWLFAIIGGCAVLIGSTISICTILSGRFLSRKIKYMYSFVMGCIECLFIPFGTVLGVFTIIVLSRDSVKHLYGRKGTGLNASSEQAEFVSPLTKD